MISLMAFIIAAFPFCEESTEPERCVAWIANECAIEQVLYPKKDLGWYLENAIELAPDHIWEK